MATIHPMPPSLPGEMQVTSSVPAALTLNEMLALRLTEIFGFDCWDDSANATASRVLKAWEEFAPVEQDFKVTTFDKTSDSMVVVTGIEYSSLCAHHLFPMYGIAHIGYVPHLKMIGLSKIPRLVRWLTHKPTTQETSTEAIARSLMDALQAKGVAVVLEASHTCMICRGVEAHNTSMVTSRMKGIMLTSPPTREEFFEVVRRYK